MDLESPVEKSPSSKYFYCSGIVQLLHQGRRMSEVVSENIAHAIPFQIDFVRVHVTQQYYPSCKCVV